MKNFILIASSILVFVSCTNNKEIASSSIKTEVKEKKKGRRYYGEITTFSVKPTGKVEEGTFPEDNLELYLKSDVDYYQILMGKGGVGRAQLESNLNKDVKVMAEIIEKNDKTVSGNVDANRDAVGYIIIYKIIPIK